MTEHRTLVERVESLKNVAVDDDQLNQWQDEAERLGTALVEAKKDHYHARRKVDQQVTYRRKIAQLENPPVCKHGRLCEVDDGSMGSGYYIHLDDKSTCMIAGSLGRMKELCTCPYPATIEHDPETIDPSCIIHGDGRTVTLPRDALG